MKVAPARRAALKALARVRRDSAYAGPVLSAELARAGLSADDAALATRLTYGTLAAEGVLDEVLATYVKGSLEPTVRDALRLAAFEMLFGRAPAYAVVDQAVSAARAVRPQAAGLANAVLRRLADDADGFPWGDPASDRDALARATAHPRWIVDVALADLGPDAGREMLATGLDPAPTYVRLDPFAASRADALASLQPASPEPSPPDPDCMRLGTPSAAFRDGARGAWFAMDAAAQVAPSVCEPRPGERVLDIGAGRGNKTVCLQALAVRSGGPADIVAVDLHAAKSRALEERLAASGVPSVRVVTADALDLAAALGDERFDVVLVDAPCTGLGTLRRYPEKRWRLALDAPARMAELQQRLLESAAAAVGSGGRLVYSTCSIARRENDDVVDAFLASETGRAFELVPLGDVLSSEWAEFRSDRGCFQSWPRSGGPDGHYVAALRRSGG